MEQLRTRHMGVHKRVVLQQIREHGAQAVLAGFTGTDEEAIAELHADPREIFCSCSCVKDERGACTGVRS